MKDYHSCSEINCRYYEYYLGCTWGCAGEDQPPPCMKGECEMEIYCKWFNNYVKLLPEHQTDICDDYPYRCDPDDCECCEIHSFDEEGNRID